MTIFIMKYFESLPEEEQSPLPPAKLADDVETTVAPRLPSSELRSFNSLASHFGYGIGAGELYSYLAQKVKAPVPVKGLSFGAALWAVSYIGWIPVAGYRPSAPRLSTKRNIMMIAAHAVWGLTAAYCDDVMARRGNEIWDGAPDRETHH
jgi:putative membrane protein